ncbi:MAG: ABC transporter ATP-binding protein [Propionicimonas sp.]
MTNPVLAGLSGRDLTLGYGGDPVLAGVGVRLPAGRVTVLIGPNGSGKSTLLRGLSRLLPLRTGEVEVGDAPLRALSPASSPGGWPSSPRAAAISGLTVREVAEARPAPAPWTLAPRGPRRACRRGPCPGLTGLTHLAAQDVGALSGGQVQRAWLASCLAQDTAVLLLDGPTTYLDLRHQVGLLDLLRDLAEVHGVTIGVVLHDHRPGRRRSRATTGWSAP